jgi:2,3-diaminopropionate biosynthesis protein SbnB
MESDSILILTGNEICSLLVGRELELIDTVKTAYTRHTRGESSLPHSTFLQLPGNTRSRIIALPAYLGEGFDLAGVKWIASFPENIHQGMDRASATMILNSALNGRPIAVLEGSVISAKRTAASAALAAQCLHQEEDTKSLGVIGCGPINYEIARFLLAVYPKLVRFIVFDLNPARANHFKNKCQHLSHNIEVYQAPNIETVIRLAPLVSFATNAPTPYVLDIPFCSFNRTILHISLRDFAPEVILSCRNIVDDIDHICRAQTSLHLAEQITGNRDFIGATLSEILNGKSVAREQNQPIVIFSPFGLGVLDIAVGKLVYDLSVKQRLGKRVEAFFPDPWNLE